MIIKDTNEARTAIVALLEKRNTALVVNGLEAMRFPSMQIGVVRIPLSGHTFASVPSDDSAIRATKRALFGGVTTLFGNEFFVPVKTPFNRGIEVGGDHMELAQFV